MSSAESRPHGLQRPGGSKRPRGSKLLFAIGLGSNLPPLKRAPFENPELEPRLRALEGALILLAEAGFELQRSSHVVESAPLGVPTAQPHYLNACLLARADEMALEEALDACGRVERAAGRVGKGDMAARPLDLDLLGAWSCQAEGEWTAQGAVNTPTLVLPHARLHERSFVLQPLAEIAPDLPLLTQAGPRSPSRLLRELIEGAENTENRLQTVPAPSFPRSWADGQP